jgi:hypothetical protein
LIWPKTAAGRRRKIHDEELHSQIGQKASRHSFQVPTNQGETMKPMFSKLASLLLVICVFLLQGCATTQPPNLGLTRSDFDSVRKITVVRYKTPALEASTKTAEVLMMVGAVCLCILPDVTALIIDGNASGDARRGLPDFGELMMKDIVTSAVEEIPGWPPTTSVEAPVKKGYTSKDAAQVVIDTKSIYLRDSFAGGQLARKGIFGISGDVIMKDSRGKKIFLRHFNYVSMKSKKELLADNHKAFIAEIPEAAQICAEEVVACLKSNLGTGNKTTAAHTAMPPPAQPAMAAAARPATPTPPPTSQPPAPWYVRLWKWL